MINEIYPFASYFFCFRFMGNKKIKNSKVKSKKQERAFDF